MNQESVVTIGKIPKPTLNTHTIQLDEAALRDEYPDDEKDGGEGRGEGGTAMGEGDGDCRSEESLIRQRRKGTGDITDGQIVV